MMRSILGGLSVALSVASGATAQTAPSLRGIPVAVQILGSGGPAFNAERASASYLLWVGPQAKLLFDIGGALICVSARPERNSPTWPWLASATCIRITRPICRR